VWIIVSTSIEDQYPARLDYTYDRKRNECARPRESLVTCRHLTLFASVQDIHFKTPKHCVRNHSPGSLRLRLDPHQSIDTNSHVYVPSPSASGSHMAVTRAPPCEQAGFKLDIHPYLSAQSMYPCHNIERGCASGHISPHQNQTVRHSVMVVHGRKSKNAWSQNALAVEQGGGLRSLRSLTASSQVATARIIAAAAAYGRIWTALHRAAAG
jgi:hypothetical protein